MSVKGAVHFLSKQIRPEIRRRIIEELAHLQSVRGQFLHGTLKPTDFLHRVGCEPPLDALLFSMFGTGQEPQTDITPYLTGLLEETDETFLAFLRLVLHPTTRFQRGRHQQSLLFLGELVSTLNKHLPAVGFEIKQTSSLGSEPLFEPVEARANPEEVRCLIFAAAEEKPDILISDLLSLDVDVRRRIASKYLVYDPPITREGLRWEQLATWWSKFDETASADTPARALYKRLAGGLQSDAERHLFYAYCKQYPISPGNGPALLPQFYLRWDPLTGRQVRVPQRYDFLLLLPKGIRVVIEVDGIQHYGFKAVSGQWEASPDAYAKTVADSRDLSLAGYEVYRFAGSELRSRDSAERIAGDFFTRLFEFHNIHA